MVLINMGIFPISTGILHVFMGILHVSMGTLPMFMGILHAFHMLFLHRVHIVHHGKYLHVACIQ